MKNCRKPLAVYVHVPFCMSKCFYCDFNSYQGMLDKQISYFSALEKELAKYKSVFAARGISSVFFGGGTPTSVNSQLLTNFLSKLHLFQIKDGENTFECNPGTADLDAFTDLYNAGFNRISIGLQSSNDEELKKLGRVHNYSQFVKTFENARSAGFSNISVDLMFGIPSQTIESWKRTLETVAAMQPEHLSCYSLKLEKGTPLHEKNLIEDLCLPNEDAEREMYYLTQDLLGNLGYTQYEISNWCKPGFDSKHNTAYWKCDEYIGLGAGAHSYFEDKRFGNISGILEYIELSPEVVNDAETVEIDLLAQKQEFVMLGLRLMNGIDLGEFRELFEVELTSVFKKEIEKLMKMNIIEIVDNHLKLTKKGIDFANLAFMEFV